MAEQAPAALGPHGGGQAGPGQARGRGVRPGDEAPRPDAQGVKVKVSGASARLPFQPCEPRYIAEVCKARCCDAPTRPTGTLITIHESERAAVEALGVVVKDGLLQPRPGERRCPFKTDDHLCGIHGSEGGEPFGCIASPFTLNANGTLIVRNRYKLLPCYGDGERLPAYVAHRASLDRIFGPAEAERLSRELDGGAKDVWAYMPEESYRMLTENDATKKAATGKGEPEPAAAPESAPAWRSRIVGQGEESPAELRANPANWRLHPPEQGAALEAMLERVGWVQQVIVNRTTGLLVDGHLRVELALRRAEPTVPVIYVELTEGEEREVLATLDPLSAMAAADRERLGELLGQMDISADERTAALWAQLQALARDRSLPELPPAGVPLSETFLVPPFSVLDARQGYWQERKREWLALGIRGELGRGEHLLHFSDQAERINPYRAREKPLTTRMGMHPERSFVEQQRAADGKPLPAERRPDYRDQLTYHGGNSAASRAMAERAGKPLLSSGAPREGYGADYDTAKGENAWGGSGTSIFDPVLCELAYRWFCPPRGRVFDPFAGGSVRGLVAGYLGNPYTGWDLSPEQVEANRFQLEGRRLQATPEWVCQDSAAETSQPEEQAYDLVFSCPPYFDLEQYTDDPRDVSNLPWREFQAAYRAVIRKAMAALRPNRFAVWVVSEVRDERGNYRRFVPETIRAFVDSGAELYNEAVLINAVGSLPLRAGRHFRSARKLGRGHQNVLVFVKGDGRKATEACGPVIIPRALAEQYGDALE